MKIFLSISLFFLLTAISNAQVTIRVNPEFSLEGKISSNKGNKPLVNQELSVYGFDMVWLVTTGANGDYFVDFSKNGHDASPPQGMDGKEKIIFYYSDKRTYIIQTKDIKFNPNGLNAPPVVHWDVKL